MGSRELYLTMASDGPRVLRDGTVPLRGQSRITCFVHGYNVEAGEAKSSFDRFITNVRAEADIPNNRAVPMLDGSRAWRLYWPAYARLGRNRGLISALTYPWHVADVGHWANAFAEYLSMEFRGFEETPVDVTFVAHSLGCRLILETLRVKLEDRCTSWSVHLVFLMAAAIPVRLVRYGGRLFSSALHAKRRCVAYSPIDPVLQVAFRAGQLGQGGVLPTAIGSSGQPVDLWTDRLCTLNGHSGYFSDRATARLLAAALGLRTRRQLGDRTIMPKLTVIRKLASVATLPLRILRGRRVGD